MNTALYAASVLCFSASAVLMYDAVRRLLIESRRTYVPHSEAVRAELEELLRSQQ